MGAGTVSSSGESIMEPGIRPGVFIMSVSIEYFHDDRI
jgi:hypothetical protein